MVQEETALEKSMNAWALENDDQKQIDQLRAILGLPKITYKDAMCRQCERVFKAQYIGMKKITHRCHYSHNEMTF